MANSKRSENCRLDTKRRWSKLMSSSQAGCEEDYKQLLRELSLAAEIYLRNRFGGAFSVEDCVQDILFAVHEARHTYNAKRFFRAWFFAIVRNKAVDRIRNERAYRSLLERKSIEAAVCGQAAPSLHDAEYHILCDSLIHILPPRDREAVVLTKIIGLSIAETAVRLDTSEGALKVQIHRAIARLRLFAGVESLE